MKLFKSLTIFCLLALFSCKNKFDEVNWNARVLTPIASSSLSMKELTQDSSIVTNSDNSISVVYESDLYAVKPLDTLINISVQPFRREITLQSLELGSQFISDTLVLGDIITPYFEEAAAGTPFSPEVIEAFFWASTISPPWSYAIPDGEPTKIDVSTFFTSAILTEGTMEFTLVNGMQLAIQSVDVEIRNTNDQYVIYTESFGNIAPGTSRSRTIDLADQMNGNEIEGELEAHITNVVFEATSPITPKPEDHIAFNLAISDVKVQSAEAIFPAQDVIDNRDTVGLQGLDGIELTKALLSDGFVEVNVRSTIPTELDMNYSIPSATTEGGETFNFNTVADAAPIGGSISYDSSFYFDGYWFDLTGEDGSLTNTFYNWITGSIEPTPAPIPLSLDDTLVIELAVKGMKASYIEGYVGNQVYAVGPEIQELKLPDALKEGGLTFEDVKMTIVFENSLGVPASIDISELTGINSLTSETASLSPLPNAFEIKAATKKNNVITPSISRFSIENAVNIFNIHPDQISYALDVQLNPDGNNPQFSNFAYIDSEIKVSIEIEIPLSVNAEEFVLSDTIDFLEEGITNPEEIKEGILSFIVYNGFPVDVDFDLFFLDKDLVQIDSLVSDAIVLAAEVNDDGQVIEAKRSKIDFEISDARLGNILGANKVVIEARMNTQGGSHVTFYDDYKLDFQLVGDFEYKVKGGGL